MGVDCERLKADSRESELELPLPWLPTRSTCAIASCRKRPPSPFGSTLDVILEKTGLA